MKTGPLVRRRYVIAEFNPGNAGRRRQATSDKRQATSDHPIEHTWQVHANEELIDSPQGHRQRQCKLSREKVFMIRADKNQLQGTALLARDDGLSRD
jgi:hypothetical protein